MQLPFSLEIKVKMIIFFITFYFLILISFDFFSIFFYHLNFYMSQQILTVWAIAPDLNPQFSYYLMRISYDSFNLRA